MRSFAYGLLTWFVLTCDVFSQASRPHVSHYSLDVHFDLDHQRLSATTTLTIVNGTLASVSELPFLLYRLLTLERVTSSAGYPLKFSQDVIPLADEPTLQANAIVIRLARPLMPGDSLSIGMAFDGSVFGYPEVMAYVKDRVSKDYTLLRPDAYAYPLLAEPTFAASLAANDIPFTYELSTTVPEGYLAACGGSLISQHRSQGRERFEFRSKGLVSRIDLAVARFCMAVDPLHQLTVYYLREDSIGAHAVLRAANQAIAFYSTEFGRPAGFGGYTIIEIPDGWGSQAGEFYFLQTAAAFRDTSRVSEVYHEIAHTWNAKASPEVQRCRYFDEAFASYFESLAVGALRGEAALASDMESSRRLFIQWGESDPRVLSTPISEYGRAEMGRHSYTKGAWSLYVLNELVGDKAFQLIIRSLLTRFADKTIDFESFQQLCEHISHRSLKKYFDEWIYGTESSDLLVEGASITDIVRRY